MFRPYPLFVGLRYTASKRDNHFVSFISLASMLGIMLGVAALITVLSVMNGFDRELKQRILGMVPHATIAGYGGLREWPQVDEWVSAYRRVEGAAPFIQAQGMLTQGGSVRGVLINGIVPDEERQVSIIDNHIVAGSLDGLKSGEFGIVVGDIIASALDLYIGDKVTMVLPEASVTPAGVFPRLKRYEVVGIFRVGAELDGSLALVHMDDAAKMLRLTDSVHGLRLKVDDLFAAPVVSRQIAAELPGNFYASDWTRTHGNLFQAIRLEKTMIGLLLMLIVVVAAFNIVSTLVMVVSDKRHDIAILRTFGARPGDIMKIFMIQGSLIGVIGTLLGTGLGILLALNVSGVIAWFESLLGRSILSPDVYFISYLPSQLLGTDVAIITGVSLLLSLLATIYPAWRAAKVNPAEALRYE